MLSEAITAIVFLQILQPGGLVDATLEGVGLGGLVQLWLADLSLVFYTLFVVITWKYIGFAIILFLAGLQGIPRELHEAAAIDGATSWTTLRYITLPLLGPTIRIWAFLAIIGSIQLFDLVWIMTLGGPAGSSSTMATYMVDQRREQPADRLRDVGGRDPVLHLLRRLDAVPDLRPAPRRARAACRGWRADAGARLEGRTLRAVLRTRRCT